MTPTGFRRIALGLKDAVEQAHHGHPDFRMGGRIFATLGYPDSKLTGMALLQLTFVPAAGAWGDQGSTTVRLDRIDEEALGEALTLAWRYAIEKGPTRSAGRSVRRRVRTRPDR